VKASKSIQPPSKAKCKREDESPPEGWQDHLRRKFAAHNSLIPKFWDELDRDLQREVRQEMAGITPFSPPPEREPGTVQEKRPRLGLKEAAAAAIQAERESSAATALISAQQPAAA
jgi:hypothetical protein